MIPVVESHWYINALPPLTSGSCAHIESPDPSCLEWGQPVYAAHTRFNLQTARRKPGLLDFRHQRDASWQWVSLKSMRRTAWLVVVSVRGVVVGMCQWVWPESWSWQHLYKAATRGGRSQGYTRAIGLNEETNGLCIITLEDLEIKVPVLIQSRIG